VRYRVFCLWAIEVQILPSCKKHTKQSSHAIAP
jgi:hypothetical protein